MTEQQLISNQPLMNPFRIGNNELRVFGSYEQPWFIANEIGKILGLSNIGNNLPNLKPTYKKVLLISYPLGGSQNTTIINEAGLNTIIMRAHKSKNPIVQQFQDWVNEEVLPSIRRTGSYHMNNRIQEQQTIIQQLQEEKQQREQEHKEYRARSRLFITPTDENRQIKLCNRLIYLYNLETHIPFEEKMTRELHDNIMRTYKFPRGNGRFIVRLHEKKGTYQSILCCISKRLSVELKDRNGNYSYINKKNRTNLYTISDYMLVGDRIILNYIQEHPFNTWGLYFDQELEDMYNAQFEY